MELKKGYKQTEVGIIPDEWKVAKLSDLLRVVGGGAFRSEDHTSAGVKWLKIANVGINEAVWDQEDFLPSSFVKDNLAFLLREGDYVMALTRPILDRKLKITRLGIADVPALLNQRVGKIFVESNNDADFAYFVLQKSQTIDAMLQSMAGTDPPNLSNRGIYDIVCPLPPTKSEQCAIAEALSDTDALIRSLDELIAKKRDIKQAAMQQLLTGKQRLPGFSGEWEEKSLGELGAINGAGVDKKSEKDEVPVRLLNYLDVFRRDFIYADELSHWVTAPATKAIQCAVRKGDVFFTPTSEMPFDIAFSAVAMEDIPQAVYSYHLVRLKLSGDWDVRFRSYIFNTQYFLQQAERACEGSGTRYVITLPKFRALKVYYPPNKKEQAAISMVLSDMDAEIVALEARREKTRLLKQGMMQELLTGRIRLV